MLPASIRTIQKIFSYYEKDKRIELYKLVELMVDSWSFLPQNLKDDSLRVFPKKIMADCKSPNGFLGMDEKGIFIRHDPFEKYISNNSSTQVAVNDHVCPTCKNDRVSKTEASCWKCGGKL